MRRREGSNNIRYEIRIPRAVEGLFFRNPGRPRDKSVRSVSEESLRLCQEELGFAHRLPHRRQKLLARPRIRPLDRSLPSRCFKIWCNVLCPHSPFSSPLIEKKALQEVHELSRRFSLQREKGNARVDTSEDPGTLPINLRMTILYFEGWTPYGPICSNLSRKKLSRSRSCSFSLPMSIRLLGERQNSSVPLVLFRRRGTEATDSSTAL